MRVKNRISALCLLAASALALASCGPAANDEETAPVVTVKVAPAIAGDAQLTVSAPATVFPRAQADIASRVTAPIAELTARMGDHVAKGQVLARLDNRDLVAQRQEAAAQVTDAGASLEKLRAGTLPGDIERAKGQVSTTEAALEQAQTIYDRRKQLYEEGAIPSRDLLVSETGMKTAKSNHDVAQRALALLEEHSSGRDIQIAQSKLEQARARLNLLDAQVAFTELRSPFAGNITAQNAFPGDMAQPSMTIFTVADLDVAVARAQAPEAGAAAVKRGQVCRFLPADNAGKSYAGRVTVVNQAVDPARRTVEVWCEIPNGKGDLRAQVYGNVEIVTGHLAGAVHVPAAAVQFEEGTQRGYVMVAGTDGKAHRRDVEAGPSQGGEVTVRSGLRPGERVIVEGGYGLPDGTAITPVEDAQR